MVPMLSYACEVGVAAGGMDVVAVVGAMFAGVDVSGFDCGDGVGGHGLFCAVICA